MVSISEVAKQRQTVHTHKKNTKIVPFYCKENNSL